MSENLIDICYQNLRNWKTEKRKIEKANEQRMRWINDNIKRYEDDIKRLEIEDKEEEK